MNYVVGILIGAAAAAGIVALLVVWSWMKCQKDITNIYSRSAEAKLDIVRIMFDPTLTSEDRQKACEAVVERLKKEIGP